MDIIEQIKALKDTLGGTFASLNIETPAGMVTITIEDGTPEEEPEQIYTHVCKTCGKEYISNKARSRTCPECHREAQRRASRNSRAKRKQEQEVGNAAKEILALGD